jgi:hypothetical protein
MFTFAILCRRERRWDVWWAPARVAKGETTTVAPLLVPYKLVLMHKTHMNMLGDGSHILFEFNVVFFPPVHGISEHHFVVERLVCG